jgi:hypothetical protein
VALFASSHLVWAIVIKGTKSSENENKKLCYYIAWSIEYSKKIVVAYFPGTFLNTTKD